MIRSVAFAAAALAVLAGAARAGTLTVSTQGLDLNSAAGAKAFYSRLSHAAIEACGGAPTVFFSSDEERFQACYRAAMDEAVAQARAPLLAQLHAGKARATALALR